MYSASILKTKPLLKPILKTVTSVIILIASAKFTVPMQVPISMQTLGLALIGLLFGSKIAVSSMISYLIMGLTLPVFAAGGGIYYLVSSPTAGYLYGMIPAIYLAGKVKDLKMNPFFAALTLFLVPIVVHLGGFLWLAAMMGLSKALTVGLFPFGVVAFCKYIISVLLYFALVRR